MIEILFRALGAFYGFYPVKLFVRKRIESYFFKYHIAQILKNASRTFSISEYCTAKDLAGKSPFRGLLSEFVRIGEFYPSPKDIAVAINISVGAYNNKSSEDESSIIDLAFHISDNIKSRIVSDQLLKMIFEDLGKDVGKIQTKSDRGEIQELFESKKALFLFYYSTFSKPEFSYSIKVWHQSQENSYIDWSEENALVVHLDPTRIREGFFQLGFDYYCNKTKSRLQRATRVGGYEQFNGVSNGKIIWMH